MNQPTASSFAIQASNIRFPVPLTAQPVVAANTPQSTVVNGLESIAAKPETREALVCFDILDEAAQAAASAEAEDLFPQMLENTQIVIQYAKDAVLGLNSLVDKLMHEVEEVDIPELEGMMRNLSHNMRQIKNKWDVSDPKVADRIREWATKGKQAWFQTKSLMEELMDDVRSIEQQIDKIVKELGAKYMQLLRNVGFLDAIYTTNEEGIFKLIYRIAVMERVVVVSDRERDAIVADPNNPADRTKVERRRVINELGANMRVRVGEFKNRLFIGWATSPQTTNMRTLDVGLAMKIDLLINLTIPTMKLTIVQWRLLIQSMQGAEMEKIVADTANEWILAYARAGAEGVQMIAEAVETPTLRPDTVATMAELIAGQADTILEARKKGAELRKDVAAAILQGYRTMALAQTRLNTAVVDDVVSKATSLKEKIAQVFPEAASTIPATVEA